MMAVCGVHQWESLSTCNAFPLSSCFLVGGTFTDFQGSYATDCRHLRLLLEGARRSHTACEMKFQCVLNQSEKHAALKRLFRWSICSENIYLLKLSLSPTVTVPSYQVAAGLVGVK